MRRLTIALFLLAAGSAAVVVWLMSKPLAPPTLAAPPHDAAGEVVDPATPRTDPAPTTPRRVTRARVANGGRVAPGVVARLPAAEAARLRALVELPDPARTPGDVLPVTAADVCVSGYSRRVRDVPSETKRAVYGAYGIATRAPGEYEVDHLVNLSIGGSNSVRNLWPQSFRTAPWNAYLKDDLENELHRRVCAGTLDLATAQRAIATDWVAAYEQYVSPTPRPPRGVQRRVPAGALPLGNP